jgi:acylphosphatase
MRRVRALVRGRVQGVGFRWSAREVALGLGLKGWVRNLPSGDVETVAEGDPDAVARYVEWLREGPPSARVERVDASDEAPTGEFRTFGLGR